MVNGFILFIQVSGVLLKPQKGRTCLVRPFWIVLPISYRLRKKLLLGIRAQKTLVKSHANIAHKRQPLRQHT